MEINGSASPGSASSSANQRWQMPKRDQRIRSMVSPTESENSGYGNPDATQPFGLEDGAHNAPFLGVVPLSEQDTYEEQTILRELSGMTNAPRDQNGQSSLSQMEDRYLAAFWQHFHPATSIIHRPTFEAVGTAPMVRALMIAIGSQFFEDEKAQSISRCLRETCLKLISRVSRDPEILAICTA